jgi:hypothetical protein
VHVAGGQLQTADAAAAVGRCDSEKRTRSDQLGVGLLPVSLLRLDDERVFGVGSRWLTLAHNLRQRLWRGRSGAVLGGSRARMLMAPRVQGARPGSRQARIRRPSSSGVEPVPFAECVQLPLRTPLCSCCL